MFDQDTMDERVVATARARRGSRKAQIIHSSLPPIIDAEMLQDFVRSLERRLKREDGLVVDLLGAPSSDFAKLVGKTYGDISTWAFKRPRAEEQDD